MASFNTPIVTTQGLALLKSAIAGTDTLTFTHLIFSADDYTNSTDAQVASLTDISSKDMTTIPQSFTDTNGNVKVRAVGYNQSTSQAFNIKSYALYATNKAGAELLFAVSTSQTADFVPAYNGKQLNQVAYTFNFSVSSSNNITFSDTHDITVTQADLASINASIQAVQNSLAHIDLSSAVKQAQSYTDSSVSSLSSQVVSSVASNASAIASNATSINSLSNTALKTIGSVPTSDLASIPNDGIYSLAGKSYDDAPYSPIYGTITQVGTGFAVKTQIIISNIGQYYYRVVNSWGIEGWYQLSNESDISNLNSSLSSMATQATSLSSSVSANSSAIASNATNISSLSSSTSQSINAVQSSVASNSSAIASNATNISINSSAISYAQSLESNAVNQINTNISSMQSQVNTALQNRGVWTGSYTNWGAHPDGIYSIDINVAPNDGSLPQNFSGHGTATLTTNYTTQDRYMTILDNVDNSFHNHQFVGSGNFSGWVQNAGVATFSTRASAQSYAQSAPAGVLVVATGN